MTLTNKLAAATGGDREPDLSGFSIPSNMLGKRSLTHAQQSEMMTQTAKKIDDWVNAEIASLKARGIE